jgi:hypothetical protein
MLMKACLICIDLRRTSFIVSAGTHHTRYRRQNWGVGNLGSAVASGPYTLNEIVILSINEFISHSNEFNSVLEPGVIN